MYWQDTWRHKNGIRMIKRKRMHNLDIIVIIITERGDLRWNLEGV